MVPKQAKAESAKLQYLLDDQFAGLVTTFVVARNLCPRMTELNTVQSMLRHAALYTQEINQDQLVAQTQVIEAMMRPDSVN
jgi:hypothetical protein